MPEYVLMLREDPADFHAMSPEEMQRVIERYVAWSNDLRATGRITGGQKLRDDGGKQLRRAGAGVVAVDGPYTEGKEVIGGYFIVKAADYDDAVAIARDCPHMAHGWIEVREIEPT